MYVWNKKVLYISSIFPFDKSSYNFGKISSSSTTQLNRRRITLCETGFDLTFQKWFESFPNKNNCQTDLNVSHHGWARKKIFHSRLPKMALNDISFTFYLNNKFVTYTRLLEELNWIKKNWIKELCKNSFENKLFGISHTCIKGSSLLL